MKKRRTIPIAAWQIITILAISLLFLLPQILHQGMVIGSDILFHYNRFYDTSQQIKDGNFQYFLSFYGFQQSARIVNPLYGPLFAYLQGLLVLITPSWFYYQLLSNGLLYALSGISMYLLIRKYRKNGWAAVGISIIFMSTFCIQYWIERQGFSAWGAALLPLCLLPLVDMVRNHRIHPLSFGLSVALMLQVHLFSSLLLVLIYLPFFCQLLYITKEKKHLLLQVTQAIGIFFLLTLNIWAAFIDLYSTNQLITPFVNQTMEKNTITGTSRYWFLTPYVLPIICVLFFNAALLNWKRLSGKLKIYVVTTAFFFILSTNIVPWKFLNDLNNPVIELIQFPFRFFVPAVVLVLSGCSLLYPYVKHSRIAKPAVLILFVILSVFQTVSSNNDLMTEWQNDGLQAAKSRHTRLIIEDRAKVKDSFYDHDKTKSLDYIQKSTPDYLPLYFEDDKNNYKTYDKQIIDRNPLFTKEVVDHKLSVTWSTDTAEKTEIPIVKYADTNLWLNGKKLSSKDITLSKIGAVTVNAQTGKNELVVAYNAPIFFKVSLIITLVSWPLISLFMVIRYRKNRAQLTETEAE